MNEIKETEFYHKTKTKRSHEYLQRCMKHSTGEILKETHDTALTHRRWMTDDSIISHNALLLTAT